MIRRNGKPFAITAPTQPSEVEDKLRAAGFGAALRQMQRHAAKTGQDKMTLEEINAEVAAARKERREREASGH